MELGSCFELGLERANVQSGTLEVEGVLYSFRLASAHDLSRAPRRVSMEGLTNPDRAVATCVDDRR